MMYQAGLVLEGGGMKGIYTAGVLDFFLDKGIEFSSCYGVSAGACHVCSYLSKQKKRAYRISVKYLKEKDYCSYYSLLKTGDLFGADFCYNRIPNELDMFNYEEFKNYKGKAYAVVTNIETGEPEYHRLMDMRKDIQWIRASSSLPLVSNNVEIDGSYYLDGGISDSIPIRKSIADGNEKNVVVLTKHEGYVRKPSSHMELIKMRYRKYPMVVENMKNRHVAYNETMEFLEEEERKGNLFIIRPQFDSHLGRLEKDKRKLRALYKQGYQEAERSYEAMKQYLDKAVSK